MAILTAVVTTASGVLFQSPGQYTFANLAASASFESGGPSNASFTDISVQRGTFVAHFTGAAPSLMRMTLVNLTIFSPSTGSFGTACFRVPDTAFAVNSDLSAASLNTVLTSDEETTDVFPVTGLIGNGGKGGGGKGGGACEPFGTVPSSIDLNINWTPSGPLGSVVKHGSYSCSGFNATFSSSLSQVESNASWSTTNGSQQTGFAAVSSESLDEVVHGSGSIDPNCLIASIV